MCPCGEQKCYADCEVCFVRLTELNRIARFISGDFKRID
jgi:hypothetical protein